MGDLGDPALAIHVEHDLALVVFGNARVGVALGALCQGLVARIDGTAQSEPRVDHHPARPGRLHHVAHAPFGLRRDGARDHEDATGITTRNGLELLCFCKQWKFEHFIRHHALPFFCPGKCSSWLASSYQRARTAFRPPRKRHETPGRRAGRCKHAAPSSESARSGPAQAGGPRPHRDASDRERPKNAVARGASRPRKDPRLKCVGFILDHADTPAFCLLLNRGFVAEMSCVLDPSQGTPHILMYDPLH